ncbi:CDP-alcohol phosphatidyltransferase family protein [Jannaschia aquimarina]|uniref:YnjF protein n=1 Tax=Jannaschia aquimarina TaxID=935700 RepID=A0A0D1EG30_9RHOB|nr:CDP-alcohol phosphatidyltransferase family protein [Jannaschia aquimarina]KIT14795.1 Inner membrane protein YnjF [Jannaschia aquimarina]SNS85306.1 Phosphatidylglycerophosphate synthase [Jannaschia aquimarina]
MFDARLRPLIDPPLNAIGRALASRGVTPDAVTMAGLAFGLLAAVSVALGAPGWALVPLLLSRLMDGLDGAVARATRPSDFGGYLDLVSDFAFYGAVPLGFAILDPEANAVAAAFLIWTFYINGASFLGFAAQAAKRGMETAAQGKKSLYYSAGLLEGTETIVFFVLLCLLPGWFATLAWGFGVLCLFTAVARVLNARELFR